MSTIAPLLLRSAGSAARANRKAAVRLTSRTRCHSSSVSLAIGRLREIPALETIASTRPNRSSAAVTARFAVSSCATSPSIMIARRSLANRRARPVPARSSAATRQPDRMSERAIADPMPLAAPVTIAAGADLAMLVRPGRDREIRPGAPFDPGAVVEAGRLLAQRVEREPQNCRGDAGTAARHDRLVEIDPAARERRADTVARNQPAVLDESRIGHVARARHMSGAHARPRLRPLAAEPLDGTRVDDLRAAAAQGLAHVLERLDRLLVLARRKPGRLAHLVAALDRPRFGEPFRQAAVEDEHVLGAEHAKRPPYPRRREQADAVVDDDVGSIADAERARRRRERLRAGQHVRQVGAV